MLSVTVPVNVCGAGSAAIDAMIRRLAIRNFKLATRRHEVRGRCAGVHDPHSALACVLRQAHGLSSGTRHGDRDVRAGVLLIGTADVEPYRSELRFRPLPSLFGGFKCSLARLFVWNGFHLQALSNTRQIVDAGALDGKWLLAGLTGPVVAHHSIGAFPQRIVGVVGLP